MRLTVITLTFLLRLIDLSTFVRVDGFPNTLEGLVAGRNVAQFEALNETKLTDDCMWLLNKFLVKSLPRPTKIRRTRWMMNRNFLGSYSYLSMAAEKNKSSPSDLAQSLLNIKNEPKILFAGEATDLKFSSYSHGAVSSGWRAANELVNHIKTKS